ncbi:MAG: Gfo/Idh/MocA family oxidoreductase [archaeon]|nr:Gfo/Idh/MocA family oxidoreductase [archaeon]
MNQNKKQTAVIGAGGFGQHHVRNYNNLSDLVAVCDLNEDIAKKQAGLYECRWYTDIDKMLKEEKIDAVSIVTQPAHIPGLTRKCAQKGINVLMEKPMGLKYEEVEQLANEYSNIRLHPGFIELYNPVMEEAKLHLSEIGDILDISSKRVGLFPRRYWGMGVVMDLTTHDIYLHQELLGDVKKVKSMVRYYHDENKEFEDSAYVLLDFGEAKSLIESNWLTPAKYRKMFISGSTGALELDFITRNIKILKSEDLTGPKPVIYETTIKNLRSKEPLKEEILDFLYSDKPKITLKDQGLKTLKVVLEVLKAGKS